MLHETGARKIRARHLEREAILYVRQSSPQQVAGNRESARRQYGLQERAAALGWPGEQIRVIDEDQGLSGAFSANRCGFQELMDRVANDQVGILLCLEVSRLVRDSADWHQLLRLAALADTLILDENAVLDPQDSNDRLLLGIKGTISEFELHSIKLRLRGGRESKALRGELRTLLPVGLEYDAKGGIALHGNAAVSKAVALVFPKFAELGSSSATARWFRDQRILLPTRIRSGPDRGALRWEPAQDWKILNILKNPRYAGAYVYGRSRHSYKADGSKTSRKLPMEEWMVCIPGSHPGYIDWDAYLANRAILSCNHPLHMTASRVANLGDGRGLLQSRAICGSCGQRMKVRYASANPARGRKERYHYTCPTDRRANGCRFIPAAVVDKAVTGFAIAAMNRSNIDLALAVHEQVRADFAQSDARRSEQIEGLRYEADLARRRHHAVDPANRQVVAALEEEWNARLQELEEACREREIFRDKAEMEMSAAQLRKVRELAEDFAKVWDAPQTEARDRKRLLGFLVEDAVLSSDGETVRIGLRMRGGHIKHLDPIPVPMPQWKQRKTRPATIQALDALLDTLPEPEATEELNRQGHANWQGEPMTLQRVRNIMNRYKLKTWTARQLERMHEEEFFTAGELAKRFHVAPITVRQWARAGIVDRRPFPFARKITHVYRAVPGPGPQQRLNAGPTQKIREAP